VSIESGSGCRGFSYKFAKDAAAPAADDVCVSARFRHARSVIERDGASVVVDGESLELLRGCTLDFIDTGAERRFSVIDNPNSESTCGCKQSFMPKAL
jgi:iron-sulfur cluster insertion protein